MTEKEYCKFALDIQDASNICGVVRSWNEAMQAGGEWLYKFGNPAEHPATQIIIYKLASLAHPEWDRPDSVVDYGWQYCKAMRSHKERKQIFRVNELTNGYEIEHIVSGRTRGLSDGVNVFENGPQVGTEGFRKTWEDTFNADVAQTLEAYFPDIED